MVGAGAVPVERVDMRTAETENAVSAVKSVVVDHRARISVTSCERLHVEVRSASAAGLGADLLRFSGISYSADGVPSDSLLVAQLIVGKGNIAIGGLDVPVVPGNPILVPPNTGWTASMHDMVYALVRFPRAQLAEHAADLCDMSDTVLRFHAAAPVAGTQAFWNNHCAYLYRQLIESGTRSMNPLVLQGLKRSTAAILLATFPNTTMTAAYVPDPAPAPSAVVRRAVEFIDGHAAQPVTLAEIAEHARVTPRALQAAFRRHLDTTPLGYLRRVRLENAHHDLKSSDPTDGATVRSIAADWGFTHPARFAAQYRTVYGVSPSHTLRGR
ncbi:AraC family transcriptional regulator [Nocardia huaxiensis]|uniref:AraC family transcriptional regulator n=1 Tax=Nocardia huaxiensis TaxID=2755382 RepID=UPI001E636471|nr:AraC family transcriptional regulator [Nocardia huaxiensis]UFS95287.1 AraC family transcriptional regulator [Nocardia huaxiensis]